MKLFKTLAFAGLAVLLGATAAYAAPPAIGNACVLISSLQGIFRTIRNLAFVGAAFILAGWAWQFITQGWGIEKKTDLTAAKDKGAGMLIGFALLFGIGIIMQFLPAMSDCREIITGWN